MFENRDLRQDLFALTLAALVVFLLVALVSYNPADPLGDILWPISLAYQPDQLVYPQGEVVTNACGRLGAFVADVALSSLGIGAFYLAGTLAVVAALLLLRRDIQNPTMRTLGWVVSLLGLTSLVTIVLPGVSPGPVVGPGGYLGALGGGMLLAHFATAGAVILALTVSVGGLMLCSDYFLFRMALAAAKPVATGVKQASHIRLPQRKVRASGKATDVEEGVVLPGETVETAAAGGPRIKFLGKPDAEVAAAAVAPAAAAAATIAEEAVEDETLTDEEATDNEAENEEEELVETAAASVVPAPKFLAKEPKLTPRIKRKAEQTAERDAVMVSLDAASSNLEEPKNYELPPIDLLLKGDDVCFDEQEVEVRQKAKILEATIKSFGYNVRVVEIETGPVIAQYEIELEAGLRLSKITNLADDLAIALRVPSVRIVAPIPGKNSVGIEVPNTNRQMVRLRDVMEEANGRVKKMAIPIYLGKDVSGHPMVEDLARMPHLLIAGRTGTGKSVCLNAIISSMLMTRRPDEVRMLMIDPKMVELSGYGTLPHLMHPVVTDMRKAEAILAWAVEKMEERYALLARAGVRQISSYNQLSEEELYDRLGAETDDDRKAIPLQLPYIVIVADEMADLMMVCGKEVEQHIIRLAQKSRAVGIHLILATQKPTVDVITGLIKSNLPARLSFQVASRTDSRVVLDEMGADKLLGDGDMLFLKPGTSQLLRGQGTYLSDEEINSIVAAVSTGEQNFVAELVSLKPKDAGEKEGQGLPNRDELYESAVDIVVRERRGSVSLLQRHLGIGYGRAARLIDFMAEDNIVGTYAGSQAREVLISIEDWERMQGATPTPSAAQEAANEVLAEAKAVSDAPAAASKSPARPARSNKIIPVPEYFADEEEEEVVDEQAEDEADLGAEAEEDYDEEAEYEDEGAEEEYDHEEWDDDEAVDEDVPEEEVA